MTPPAICRSVPNARGSRRFWRQPIQTSAAPSSAQVAALQRPSNASGMVRVRNTTPRAMKASTSNRCVSCLPLWRPHASARYRALTAAALYASAKGMCRTSADCSPNATAGTPKTIVPSTYPRSTGRWRNENRMAMATYNRKKPIRNGSVLASNPGSYFSTPHAVPMMNVNRKPATLRGRHALNQAMPTTTRLSTP